MKNLSHVFETEPYGCTSTKYEDAFWRNEDSPICYSGKTAYYVSDESLYSYNLSNGAKKKLSSGLSWSGPSLVQWEGNLREYPGSDPK